MARPAPHVGKLARANGTTLQESQQLGDWASFDMVLRYAHLSSDHLKSAAENVAVTNLLHSQLQHAGGS